MLSFSIVSMTSNTRLHAFKLAKVLNALNTAKSFLINTPTNANIYLANLTDIYWTFIMILMPKIHHKGCPVNCPLISQFSKKIQERFPNKILKSTKKCLRLNNRTSTTQTNSKWRFKWRPYFKLRQLSFQSIILTNYAMRS